MVGKTNLTFISKEESSSVQLIQKSYVTNAGGKIWKIEVINGKFFVFVGGDASAADYVLIGTDMSNLQFAMKDGKKLRVTHIIFKDGVYYFTYFSTSPAGCYIYETEDFNEYKEILVKDNGSFYNTAIFLNPQGNIVYLAQERKSSYTNVCIWSGESMEELLNNGFKRGGTVEYQTDFLQARMIDGSIYTNTYRIDSMGNTKRTGDLIKHSYAGGYFFYMKDVQNLYRSRDGINATLASSEMGYANIRDKTAMCVIPISDEFCFIYETSDRENYVNIADNILDVGAASNPNLKLNEKMDITSTLEYGEKTYVGTSGGIIYELQLDYDGIIHRPDLTLIKTMSAKQALSQSLQYTDECMAKLESYIDAKIQTLLSGSGTEEDSTGVE